MRATILVLALLAAGCGSVTDRGDCRTSAGCPKGAYCAHTPDGNVCWPDAVPPAIASVTVACGVNGCFRDGSLDVTVEVTDDKEVFAVDAAIDLAPTRKVSLIRGGGSTWTGTISLDALEFPALTQEAVVTHLLSLSPLRRIMKDYFIVCDSYYQAIRTQPPSRIQAIDMGRRALHDEGSRLLTQRLEGKITLDHDTARRLFTLICALHWRG